MKGEVSLPNTYGSKTLRQVSVPVKSILLTFWNPHVENRILSLDRVAEPSPV